MKQRVIWWGVFLACLVPLGTVIWAIVANSLGPDPAKEVVLLLGLWTIRFLVLVLCITPLVTLFKWKRIGRFRRMIGLYVWFYASLHFIAYLVFLLNWQDLWVELTKRPFIIVGFLAFLILTALGVTSNRAMMRRLGRQWKVLHRLVYAAAVLVSLHFIWLSRSDLTDALFYSLLFALLLGYRLVRKLATRQNADKRLKNNGAMKTLSPLTPME